MSSSDPLGGGSNPFEGIFGDIFRLIGSSSTGPLNWDVAKQVATLIAGNGQVEPNVDPLDRIQLEELARVAELHVNQVSSLQVNVRAVETLNHVEWAHQTLDAYRPLLEKLAEGLSLGQSTLSSDSEVTQDLGSGAMPFGQIERLMRPLLMGMQAGGMVGHLSRRTLGQYDLPIPRMVNATLVLVPANIRSYAADWSLPYDELSLYVSVEETTRLGVLSQLHVHRRISGLLTDYASSFERDEHAVQERLDELDLGDPSALSNALSDPQSLLGAVQTDRQRQIQVQLNAVIAAYLGYVDHVVKAVAARTIASAGAIAEANKRRRVEESDGNRIVERLFGLELTQTQFDRGEAFIEGILERAGETGLGRLWHSEYELPTPAEVDAPGLWLERIDIPH